MKNSLVFSVLMTCVSLLIGLFLVEVTVRALGLVPAHVDPRTVGLAKITEFDSVLDSVYRPNSSTEIISPYGEFENTYTIDSHGFRKTFPGSEEERDAYREAADRSILFLGNSFVEGWGLADSETLIEQIRGRAEARGQQLGIVNGGISGYGAAQSYLLAKQLLDQSDPDLVVIFFIATMVNADAGYLPRASMTDTGIATGLDIDAFLNTSGASDTASEQSWFDQPWARTVSRYSAAFRLLRTRLQAAQATNAIVVGDPESDLFAAIRPSVNFTEIAGPSLQHIAALADLVSETDKRFVLVHLPLPVQLSSVEWDLGRVPYRFEDPVSEDTEQAAVQTFCDESEIDCWFAHDTLTDAVALEETDARIYYRYDFHFNPLGTEILADWLDQRLSEIGY